MFLDIKYELGGKRVIFYYAKEMISEMILLKNTSVANVLSGRNRHAILYSGYQSQKIIKRKK